MNNKLQKRLVATDKAIDPSLVTAEDLVRAIQTPFGLGRLVTCLGLDPHDPHKWSFTEWELRTIGRIANLITLPEQQPQTDNRVVWRGEMPEPLPFSEPINGVEQS